MRCKGRRGSSACAPARYIILPLARSGVCGESAPASIVLGMVITQNTIPPAITRSATRAPTRRITPPVTIWPAPDSSCCRPPSARQRERYLTSALLRLAIWLVAIVAGTADVGKCDLELVECLCLILIVVNGFLEGRNLRLEVGFGFPDFWQGSRILSRLRWLREQAGKLLGGLLPLCECRVDLGHVKRIFTAHHLVHVLKPFQVSFHKRFAL